MFPCTKCGSCCRRIKEAVKNAMELSTFDLRFKEVADFPFGYDENGSCDKLINNQCSVYEERPLICNIDKMGELLGIEQSENYKINIQSCNSLMVKDGIFEQYKIIE